MFLKTYLRGSSRYPKLTMPLCIKGAPVARCPKTTGVNHFLEKWVDGKGLPSMLQCSLISVVVQA